MTPTRPLRVIVLLIPLVLASVLSVSRAGSRSVDPKQLATLECNPNAAAWTTRRLASGREFRIVSNSDRDYGTGYLVVEYLTEFNPNLEWCAIKWEAWDLLNDLKPEAEARGDDSIFVIAMNERIGQGSGINIDRRRGGWEFPRFWTDNGPDCTIVDSFRRKPEDLLVAVTQENLPAARALLAQNHDVNETGDPESAACRHVDCEEGGLMAAFCGTTPLHFAAYIGDPDMVELLLQAGANVNAVAPCGSTPAASAASHGHADIFRMLVRRGADLELRNQQGETALMLAARSANGSAVRLLLEAGADPNVSDDSGRTPLMHAMLHKTTLRKPTAESADCYRRIMRVLVIAGADPKARDRYRKTVRDLARENGDAAALDLLSHLAEP